MTKHRGKKLKEEIDLLLLIEYAEHFIGKKEVEKKLKVIK